MRSALCFWKFKLLGKIYEMRIHVLFRPAFGHAHRFTSVKVNFDKKSKVDFYPDLFLEISIDLLVLKSILINRFKFYPDLSLDIS